MVPSAVLPQTNQRLTASGRAFPQRKSLRPKVSVVIPVRPGSPSPLARLELVSRLLNGEDIEVIIARGTSPSEQRNAAVRCSSGEILLFLDDDSEPTPELLTTYLSVLGNNPSIQAVGGPAEEKHGNLLQDVSRLVLGEPLFMGRSASRYRSRGRPRLTDERELILCNLAVRRSAFEGAGGFDADLYPNEENALLERLKARGAQLLYHPDALVFRKGKKCLGSFLRTLFGYGRGRGEQAWRGMSPITCSRLALAFSAAMAFAAGLLAAIWEPTVLASLGTLYLLYLGVSAVRLTFRTNPLRAVLGSGLGALVQGCYVAGVLVGAVRGPRRLAGSVTSIVRHSPDENSRMDRILWRGGL